MYILEVKRAQQTEIPSIFSPKKDKGSICQQQENQLGSERHDVSVNFYSKHVSKI